MLGPKVITISTFNFSCEMNKQIFSKCIDTNETTFNGKTFALNKTDSLKVNKILVIKKFPTHVHSFTTEKNIHCHLLVLYGRLPQADIVELTIFSYSRIPSSACWVMHISLC